MGNVLDLDGVYLELPEELVNESESITKEELVENPINVEEIKIPTEEEEKKTILVESRTTKLSLEELQRKLEETQALHLND